MCDLYECSRAEQAFCGLPLNIQIAANSGLRSPLSLRVVKLGLLYESLYEFGKTLVIGRCTGRQQSFSESDALHRLPRWNGGVRLGNQ